MDDHVNGPSMPSTGVDAAIVAMNWGTTPGERRAAVCRECRCRDSRSNMYINVHINIGEIQTRLSLKAQQRPDHRFDDLFSLICREFSASCSPMTTSPATPGVKRRDATESI